MLSYQHGYHAGNFADVHKHTALCLLLKYFSEQSKLITYIDTHSGRGLYDLEGDQANKTGEWKDGYGRLDVVSSDALKLYAEQVRQFQDTYGDNSYPGSPKLTQQMMAANHHLVLFELHPTEFEHLGQAMGEDKRIRLLLQNAEDSLVDYLPARKNAGLLLIDPPYELKDEYHSIAKLAIFARKRWPGGTICLWYPLLSEGRHEDLKAGLKGATFYELVGPEKDRGMYGTGLALFNAPDGFDAAFKEAEQEMKGLLFQQ